MGLPKIAAYDLPTAGEMPKAKADWAFDPARAALLIHDMQNYFLAAFPPESTPIARSLPISPG